MKDLRSLSDQQILHQAKSLAVQERQLTAELLLFLKEVDRRRLFARSYGSLFEYVTKDLGYSAGSAKRRIDSMRLLKDLPEVEQKIKDGSLTLTQISQAQQFFQNEVKSNKPMSSEQKKDVLTSLEGKSTRESERELLARSSNPESLIHKDKIKSVTENLSEVRFVADQELLSLLDEVKGLLSHSKPNLTLAELIGEAAKLAVTALKAKKFKLKQRDMQSQEGATSKIDTKDHPEEISGAGVKAVEKVTKRDAAIRENAVQKPTVANNANGKARSRYIPAAVKRAVYLRDQGMCAYVDPVSGKRCSSKAFVEYDHTLAFAKNGDSSIHNLALKCKNHNVLHAISDFSQSHMAKFVPSLR